MREKEGERGAREREKGRGGERGENVREELAREAEERGGGPTVVPNVAFGVRYSPAGDRRRAASLRPRSIHRVVIIAVGGSCSRQARYTSLRIIETTR